MLEKTSSRARRLDRLCAAAATLLPLWPHRGVFGSDRLFYVRDLAAYFWPHHLWLRRVLTSGESPLWDPNPGLGYATVADPALQIFFPPTLALRLLLPPVLGFNLAVALPFPIAGLGAYLYLRRQVAPAAACLGSLVFALGGPYVSAANCMNIAWSAAALPWMLLVVDRMAERVSPRLVGVLSLLFALSFLPGEPVTFGAAAGLTLAYALMAGTPGRPRLRLLQAALGALGLAFLLCAVQLLPLAAATRRSIRGAGWLLDGWSLNPARVLEIVAPLFFGNYLGTPGEIGPWLGAVNQGREPYLISLYLGPMVVCLAACGAFGLPRRRSLFWLGITLLAGLAALGDYLPGHGELRGLVPALRAFRYPAKLAVIAAFGAAMLAGLGADRVIRGCHRSALAPALVVGLLIAGAAAGALTASWLDPAAASATALSLARNAGLGDPAAGAAFLAASVQRHAPSVLLLALGSVLLLALAGSTRQEARLARAGVVWVALADITVASGGLNPTIEAAALAEPAWLTITREHPEARVFISQNFSASTRSDADLPQPAPWPPREPVVRARTRQQAQLPAFPSAWGAREALSQELTGLRPREYLDLIELHAASDRAGRTRLLRRLGVRYYVLPRPPDPAARKRLSLPGFHDLALYELAPQLGRLSLVKTARVESGTGPQLALFAAPGFDPLSEVVVDHEPPPAGRPAPGWAAAARILSERATRVEVAVDVPEPDAYLVLADAFDPDWVATVDEVPASIVRANGLLRAVRLRAGTHRVVFDYRPRAFVAGLFVSLPALGGLAALWFARGWPGRPAAAATGSEPAASPRVGPGV